MKRTEPAYILTGGRSRRFGSPKCIAEIDGIPMLEIVAANLQEIFTDIYQVGKQAYGELPFVADIRPDQNPLTGIVSALRHCPDDWALIIACDLPKVDGLVLEKLAGELSDEYQIILPEVGGYRQYTCAFYKKSLLPLLEEKLATADPALHRIVEAVRYKSVQFSAADKFLNVNRVGDLG
ncbi:MAG: molybdenum cofactor guanylyltransferase [Candidatus Neomarinimicrobiota bacterium]